MPVYWAVRFLSLSLTAEATTVFSEDFESFSAGTDITGQGGWFYPDTLTFDAFAPLGGPSAHNTEVLLHSAGFTTVVSWQIESTPLELWRFLTPGGSETFDKATVGGFNEIVNAEIWFDPVTEETWGVLTTGSGTFTTSRFSITAAQIASLTLVTVLTDYRNFPHLVGAEYDNILVRTDLLPPAPVPTLTEWGMFSLIPLWRTD